MDPDWKALLPHRPLDPGTGNYVSPPAGGGGERIARWILAERTTVLVAGPVGIGKSTELAHAAHLLQSDRAACLVRLDRFENMKRVTVEQILRRITGQLATFASTDLAIPLSRNLRTALEHAGIVPSTYTSGPFVGHVINAAGKYAFGIELAQRDSLGTFEASPLTLLNMTIAEVTSASPHRRVTLLLDGLEKMTEGPGISEVFEALGMLTDDVDLVTVLPWFLAFGAGPETTLRAGEHLVALRAPEVDGEQGQAGRTFLRQLLAKRLGWPFNAFSPPKPDGIVPTEISTERLAVFDRAAAFSGGVPRTFLQLVADAGTYARMRRKDPWPDTVDLADAVLDQGDSFRRILRKSDSDAILAVIGDDGRELEFERKIRLLAHGVMLERLISGASVLTVHPLVKPLLGSRVTRA